MEIACKCRSGTTASMDTPSSPLYPSPLKKVGRRPTKTGPDFLFDPAVSFHDSDLVHMTVEPAISHDVWAWQVLPEFPDLHPPSEPSWLDKVEDLIQA